METTGASFMELIGRILEMILPEHAEIQTPWTPRPQVIKVPQSANGPIRTRLPAIGMQLKYSIL